MFQALPLTTNGNTAIKFQTIKIPILINLSYRYQGVVHLALLPFLYTEVEKS